MTRRQWAVIAVGGGVVLVSGFAIGYALTSGSPEATPTPTPTPDITCQVEVSPSTIRVDPDTGDSDDVLVLVGAGFPPTSVVTVDFGTGSGLDATATEDGDLSVEIQADAGVTHPAPPDLAPGPTTWTVAGPCEVEVELTIEYTHASSATPTASPPTDLSAGGYAEILADGVRVRVEPSLSSTVVGALFTGDVVRILEPAQIAEGLVWYRVESVVIQSGEQVRGYVAAGADGQVYLRPTTEPPPPTPTPLPSPTASP